MRQIFGLWFIIGALFFTPCNAHSAMRVAVIDSGYSGDTKNLCATGHYDFILNEAVVSKDDRNHGTHVVNAIKAYAKADYCIIILKVFNSVPSELSGERVIRAIQYATSLGVDIINMSLDGPEPMNQERDAIAAALNKGIKVFVAAGNKKINLDKTCNTYPACYKLSSSVVGSNSKEANYAGFAFNKQPWCYNGECGTSLSTGIATGKFITDMEKYR